MIKGTINTRILKRSILKHIARNDITGVGVGMDYAVLDKTSSPSVLIVADGYSAISEGMALQRALNNLATAGARAEKIMISLIANSDCTEQIIRDKMNSACKLAKERGLHIIGGNTAINGDGENLAITITAYGRTDESILNQLSDKAVDGDVIIIIGDAGAYGTSLIAETRGEEMLSRFAESYIASMHISEDKLDIYDKCQALIEGGVSMIHDVSFGGIYRTLVEVSERTGLGIDILHEDIPIKQNTIEACEFWNINPYQLLGTGGIVAVCHEEKLNDIKAALEKRGIEYSVAGKLTKDGARVVHSGDDRIRRSLNYYEGDEIFNLRG